MTEAALFTHLWQSSWFALAAGGGAWALRRHDARLRFRVWMAASLKFLVPFGALAALVPEPVARLAQAAAPPAAVKSLAFTSELVYYEPATRSAPSHFWLWVWAAGAAAFALRWVWQWWRVRSAETEPGVWGIFRQRIVIPPGIEARLSAGEFAAVLAHERAHMRRRDNLWAALHGVVEIVFWFHPFVWIIGARMVSERERACDESVLASGGDRATYANAMLQVCRHYLQLPACVAGISGGSLAERVRRVLGGARGRTLSRWQKVVVSLAAAVAIGAPIVVLAAQQTMHLAAFDAATIKPAAPLRPDQDHGLGFSPGRIAATSVPLRHLIEAAYDLRSYQLIGPAWLDSDRFDLAAEAQHPLNRKQMTALLQPFLVQQFALKTHRIVKVMPVYRLMVTDASKLHAASSAPIITSDFPPRARKLIALRHDQIRPGAVFVVNIYGTNGTTMSLVGNVTLPVLANALADRVDRPILEATGLSGIYAIHLNFSPTDDSPAPGTEAPSPAPSLFTALEQQMGLKLVATKAPIEQLVIDDAAKSPKGN